MPQTFPHQEAFPKILRFVLLQYEGSVFQFLSNLDPKIGKQCRKTVKTSRLFVQFRLSFISAITYLLFRSIDVHNTFKAKGTKNSGIMTAVNDPDSILGDSEKLLRVDSFRVALISILVLFSFSLSKM